MSAYRVAPLYHILYFRTSEDKKYDNYHQKLETLKGRYSSTVQVAFKSCSRKALIATIQIFQTVSSQTSVCQKEERKKMLKGKGKAWADWHHSLISWTGALLCPMQKLFCPKCKSLTETRCQEQMTDCLSPVPNDDIPQKRENHTDTMLQGCENVSNSLLYELWPI